MKSFFFILILSVIISLPGMAQESLTVEQTPDLPLSIPGDISGDSLVLDDNRLPAETTDKLKPVPDKESDSSDDSIDYNVKTRNPVIFTDVDEFPVSREDIQEEGLGAQWVQREPSAFEAGILKLSEKDLIRIVIAESEAVKQQQIEELVARQNIINAGSIYDPVFDLGYTTEYKKEQNTSEEAIARDSQSEYESEDEKYYISVSGKIPFGTGYKLFYDMEHKKNSLQSDGEYDKEYRAKYGIELTQPLLRNLGPAANSANITISENNLIVEKQKVQKAKMLSVYKAGTGYADLQLAQEIVILEQKSLELLNKQSGLIANLVTGGKLSKTDLYFVESNIARREARLSFSRKYARRASAYLRQLLLGTSLETIGRLQAIEQPPALPEVFKSEIFVSQISFNKRPEYQQVATELNMAKTRFEYADNQDLPTLDLKATYGYSALNEDLEYANGDLDGSIYNFRTVGLHFSMPMFGGQSESALAAAKLRYVRAEQNLKNMRARIKDEIFAALSELEHSFGEAAKTREVVRRLRQLVEEDRKQLQQGRKRAMDLLSREIEMLQAQITFIEKRTDYRKAELNLKLAEGSILDHYDTSDPDIPQ